MKQLPHPVRIGLPILIGCLAIGWGQTPIAPAPMFEVASIKPNTDLTQQQSGLRRVPGGGLNATNVTVRFLIAFAYDIRDHQLSGGPAWLDTDRWDVLAKPSSDAAAAEPGSNFDAASTERLRLRMRTLLADRFQLVVHRETKEAPIYALVVAKGGPKLEVWKDGGSTQLFGHAGGMEAHKVTMKMLAETLLARNVGRTVVDRTGLTGEYNFTLTYAPDPPKAPGDSSNSADLTGSSMIDAIREQLGLRLVPQKGPVEVLIVDRAEKASVN